MCFDALLSLIKHFPHGFFHFPIMYITGNAEDTFWDTQESQQPPRRGWDKPLSSQFCPRQCLPPSVVGPEGGVAPFLLWLWQRVIIVHLVGSKLVVRHTEISQT